MAKTNSHEIWPGSMWLPEPGLSLEEQCRQERQACSCQDLSNFHARLEEYLRFSAPLWPRICRMFGDYAISVSGRKEAKETAAELSAIIQARLTSVY